MIDKQAQTAFEAIVGMQIQETTDLAEVMALCQAIARIELERQAAVERQMGAGHE